MEKNKERNSIQLVELPFTSDQTKLSGWKAKNLETIKEQDNLVRKIVKDQPAGKQLAKLWLRYQDEPETTAEERFHSYIESLFEQGIYDEHMNASAQFLKEPKDVLAILVDTRSRASCWRDVAVVQETPDKLSTPIYLDAQAFGIVISGLENSVEQMLTDQKAIDYLTKSIKKHGIVSEESIVLISDVTIDPISAALVTPQTLRDIVSSADFHSVLNGPEKWKQARDHIEQSLLKVGVQTTEKKYSSDKITFTQRFVMGIRVNIGMDDYPEEDILGGNIDKYADTIDEMILGWFADVTDYLAKSGIDVIVSAPMNWDGTLFDSVLTRIRSEFEMENARRKVTYQTIQPEQYYILANTESFWLTCNQKGKILGPIELAYSLVPNLKLLTEVLESEGAEVIVCENQSSMPGMGYKGSAEQSPTLN